METVRESRGPAAEMARRRTGQVLITVAAVAAFLVALLSATSTQGTAPQLTLTVTPTGTSVQALDFALQGPPGADAVILVSDSPGPLPLSILLPGEPRVLEVGVPLVVVLARLDSSGSFRITFPVGSPPPGFPLYIQAFTFTIASGSLQIPEVSNPTSFYTGYQLGAVRGRLVDPAGAPLGGATLHFAAAPGTTVQTGADGAFFLGPVAAQAQSLEIDARQSAPAGIYGTQTLGVQVPSQQVLALGDVQVLPAATVLFQGAMYQTAAAPFSVANGDVDSDGDLDIVTANYDTDSVNVLRNLGGGAFGRRSNYNVGSGARDVALGDVNGDGDLDIVVANSSGRSVTVLMHQSQGTFGGRTDYRINANPHEVALGDVDGDGDLDIVTANYLASSLTVILNQGQGVFGAGTYYDSSLPTSLALGDVDGDGDLDMVSAHAGRVTVLLNQQGRFGGGTRYTVGSGVPCGTTSCSGTGSVALGDVDGDGDLDIVNANNWAPTGSRGSVTVLKNQGQGVFGARADYLVGTGAVSVALGDIDGDGTLDIATANPGVLTAQPTNGPATVLFNQGQGLFGGRNDYLVGTFPRSVALDDVDGDGDLDMVTASYGNSAVTVLENRGQGAFGGRSYHKVGAQPGAAALADVDRDGDLDIVTANLGQTASDSSVTVLENQGRGVIGRRTDYPVAPRAWTLAVGDVNGDGDPDVVTANIGVGRTSMGSVTVLINQGLGVIGARTDYPVARDPYSIALGDMNGDGVLDILTGHSAGLPTGPSMTVLLNQGQGVFGAGTVHTATSTNGSAALGDVDGDGDLDIVTTNSATSQAVVLVNQGQGVFLGQGIPGARTYHAVGSYPSSVAVGDVDSDGDQDIVTGNRVTKTVTVLLNQGRGTFASGTDYPCGRNPDSIELGDINGDGDLDIMARAYGARSVTLLLSQGQGTFAGLLEYAVAKNVTRPALGDLDGDGDRDAVVPCSNNAVTVLLNELIP